MERAESPISGVSLDLFGTLVTVEHPDDPADAIRAALEAHNVPVPDDWHTAYTEPHVDVPAGAELPLPDHVDAALASRFDSNRREWRRTDVEVAVDAVFDVDVRTREGAARVVDALAERTSVGLLSNCSVPGLAERTLTKSDIDETAFDAVVTSVGCGWRKPDSRAFGAVARELDVEVERLLHVGDDSETDGGATAAGAVSVDIDDTPLANVPNRLEERWE